MIWAPAVLGQGFPVEGPTPDGPGGHITLALLPASTTVEDLATVPGLAPGLLSPGLGEVSQSQTFLDITQGNRVFDSLYDADLGHATPGRGRVRGWEAVLDRAKSAPADIVPGLLGSIVPTSASPGIGTAALLAADENGRLRRINPRCAPCMQGLFVTTAETSELRGMVDSLREDNLLIAVAEPEPGSTDLVALGIAGRGFDGNLTSDSTRLRGYVLSTDIAPTILDHFAYPVPKEMSGEPIHSEGRRDPAAVESLGVRLADIPDRRSPVIGVGVLIWLFAVALVTAATRGGAGRICVQLLAMSLAYLPLMLLLGGALEPSLLAERLLLGLGAPLLGAATLAVFGAWRALAVACGLTTVACAVDMIAGSPFTALSLLGPSPGLGVRFYGIGNELEAILAPLIVVGLGAGIVGFFPRLDPVRAAIAFLVAGFICAGIFGAGRFGADVGAVIVFPVGVAVAAAVLTRRRKVVLFAIAAPVVALAFLALIDLVTGGNSHLTRSVLDAGGLHELGNVAERRLRLSGRSFVRAVHSPFLPIVILLIGFGVYRRDRIVSWLGDDLVLRAAFAGAVAATVIGTLANDSGALLLELGTGYTTAFLGFAWAQDRERSDKAN